MTHENDEGSAPRPLRDKLSLVEQRRRVTRSIMRATTMPPHRGASVSPMKEGPRAMARLSELVRDREAAARHFCTATRSVVN